MWFTPSDQGFYLKPQVRGLAKPLVREVNHMNHVNHIFLQY